jgi:hypothetical protein
MLASKGVALDLGWLSVLRDLDRDDSPNRSVSGVSQRDQRIRDAIYAGVMDDLRGAGFADLLLFAEHLVVNEFFILDASALDARLGKIPDEVAPYVQLRRPPDDVYRAAAQAVSDLAESLWEARGESPALSQLLEDMTADGATEFWSTPDKRLHDYMLSSGSAMRLVASAASTGGDTLSRALFYLEFGRHLGDVPLLGPGKRRWLQIIGKSMESSLHEILAKRFDSIVLAQILDQLPEAFAAMHLRTPPVAELVLKKAISEGLTLLESATRIRTTPEATDYRGMLSELRDCLGHGRSGILDAQRALVGLNKIAESWAAHNDAQIGVTHRPRTISFEKLPYIGELLKAADMSKFEIRDRILDAPPGYLAFISSWYREQPSR